MTREEAVVQYLEDAEAAERNFEDALTAFSKAGEQEATKGLFAMAAKKAKTQHERLAARLKALGGSPSKGKSLLAHTLAFTPLMAQIGQNDAEKNTQHLIVTFAAAAAEMAMYESLATVAASANDEETEQLARQLQREEREDYDQVWALLKPSAQAAFETVMRS